MKKGLDLIMAYKIMGKLIIGIDNIDRFIGFIPKDLRLIPFTEQELEIHANEGHRLYFEISHTNNDKPLNIERIAKIACGEGNKIGQNQRLFWSDQFDSDGSIKKGSWFYNDSFVRNTTPKLGWCIASEEVIYETLGLNYVDQTDILIDYVKRIYKNCLPDHYKIAISRWEEERLALGELLMINGSGDDVSRKLIDAKITSLIRESYASTAHRYALIFELERKKILYYHRSWSNTISSDNRFVDFGFSGGTSGAHVGRYTPVTVWPDGGAIFFRQV